MAADLTKPHKIVDARNSSFKSVLFDGAVEGHVLLKNTNNALPLKTPKLLSIFGYSAKAPDWSDVGGILSPWYYGAEPANVYEILTGFTSGSAAGFSTIAFNGTMICGGGSGATSQSRFSAPFDALIQQAETDDTEMFWDFVHDNPDVNPMSDACLVFANAWASEGYDRGGLRDDYTDGMIKNVASKCGNTIVIFHNAGARLVEQWVDHPNVTALIFAHLPGQQSGKALVSILYGQSNPSGKLPYTVARNESDYAAQLSPDTPQGIFIKFPQSNFTEGTLIDYRHFDAKNITPRFEFGYGLSYTTFGYSNLAVNKNSTTAAPAALPTGAVGLGGQTDLWDVLATITADVSNTGSVDGAEVAQLYVGIPGAAAPRQLRGFEKPFIKAGQKATVTFPLTRRDLSVWDTVSQKWRLPGGSYGISVGSSSRNLPLQGQLVF
jgi:beta-glucosidase